MRARALVLFACFAVGCGDCAGRSAEREPAAEATAALQQPKPAAQPEADDRAALGRRSGWIGVNIEDKAPICVFSDLQARADAVTLDDVKLPTLHADGKMVIGAFAPWCVNEACDDRPSLQCWVDREGSDLVVHTRYWGDRKPGSICKDVPCRPINADCMTPPLEAGTYTVRYAGETLQVEVPGTVRSPCIGEYPNDPPEE